MTYTLQKYCKGTHVSCKCIKITDSCSLAHIAAVITQISCELAHIHNPRQYVPLLRDIVNPLPCSVMLFLITVNMCGVLLWDTHSHLFLDIYVLQSVVKSDKIQKSCV